MCSENKTVYDSYICMSVNGQQIDRSRMLSCVRPLWLHSMAFGCFVRISLLCDSSVCLRVSVCVCVWLMDWRNKIHIAARVETNIENLSSFAKANKCVGMTMVVEERCTVMIRQWLGAFHTKPRFVPTISDAIRQRCWFLGTYSRIHMSIETMALR